ncbi:hypothetical protein WJX73_007573 [Symbiochloris irregularis]|uniref:MICOS complex subunit MIC10 n=1 Tax=Symbiochloris irregularis TaxID=706552 RepID=A0AAW1PRF8_9CHLO
MSNGERPKELYIDEKWDHAIDIGLRRVVYGTLAGGAAALLLFRGAPARAAAIAFGSGAGAGSAYTDSQKELQKVLPGPPK